MLEISKEFLAELVKSNSPVLNEKPLKNEKYDIGFELDGFKYKFSYDGTYWNWEYSAK